jgi:hypothetical protein
MVGAVLMAKTKAKVKKKPGSISVSKGSGNLPTAIAAPAQGDLTTPAAINAQGAPQGSLVVQQNDVHPFDLEAAKAALAGRRDAALNALSGQRASTLLDYGFRLSDPNNPLSDLIADPNNPASKLAMLQQSYQHARNGDLTGYAAAGQRNSGAYERQVAARNRDELLGTSQLSHAAQGILGGIAGQEAQVKANFDAVDVPRLLSDWAAGTTPGEVLTTPIKAPDLGPLGQTAYTAGPGLQAPDVLGGVVGPSDRPRKPPKRFRRRFFT